MHTKNTLKCIYVCHSYVVSLITSNNESALRSRMELGKAPMHGHHSLMTSKQTLFQIHLKHFRTIGFLIQLQKLLV